MNPGTARSWWRHSILFVASAAIAVLMVLPIAWLVVTSLKPEAEIYRFPPSWLPVPFTLDNYLAVLRSSMPLYFLNSIIVAVGTIILTLFIAMHAGYAVSRFDFRGKKRIPLPAHGKPHDAGCREPGASLLARWKSWPSR